MTDDLKFSSCVSGFSEARLTAEVLGPLANSLPKQFKSK